ncbi:MAG: hypothetical protein ACI4HI_11865 [Lachnospiraceae bacterium]
MAITVGASMGKDYFLRNYYKTNTDARKKATRTTMSTSKKSEADTEALKRALKDLEKVDYENTEKDGELYNKFLAFVSTYNNTIESNGEKGKSSSEWKRMQKQMKQVTEKYKDAFSEMGVTVQKDGTLKLEEGIGDKFSIERMKTLFDKKEGAYRKELFQSTKKMFSLAVQESNQGIKFDSYA